jgi:hypothetical protein
MLRAYLAIFRQLFVFRNRNTALVLQSKYFGAVASDIYSISGNTHERRGQKYGRRNRKIAREQRKSCVLKKTCSIVSNDSAVTLKHFDLRTGAV